MGPRGERGASGGRYRKEADHTGATRLDNIVITIVMAGTRILTARLPDSIVDRRATLGAESEDENGVDAVGKVVRRFDFVSEIDMRVLLPDSRPPGSPWPSPSIFFFL